ncbi:MAG: hypothetical protein OXI79_09575 [Gammaproteobacteria bacterium]|nr:hypothetical protein [Gammaproteobacteria bacterium]
MKIWINFERPALEDRVIATFAIWEAESDPCNLWSWLADKGGTDPCFYMTKGGGIQVPLMSPTSRVIDFTLPGLGDCELAGPVDGDRWIAHLRCGPTGYLYYWVNLTRGFTEYPRG